jgi:uncharacterized protein YndB with AHSA1/START domain
MGVSKRTLRLEQPVNASRAVIWRACTEQNRIRQWQADEVRGQVAPGETLSLHWPTLGVELELRVREMERERRVRFESGPTGLTLELADGKVALTHTGLGGGDELEGITSSWRLSLAQLAHYCERHPERTRSVTWLTDVAHTSHQTAYVFFTDGIALESWLGKGTGIGAVGESYSLDLGDELMTGTVLANTPERDIALSWSEDGDSMLFLRTLPHPDGDQRVVVLTWSRWTETPAPTRRTERLEAAHRRLVQALGRRVQA